MQARLLRLLWAMYARVYERLVQLLPYQEMVEKIIDSLDLDNAPSTESTAMLDVGCGPGLLMQEVRARSLQWRLVGIDSSPAMLVRAQQGCGINVELMRVDLDEPLTGQHVVGPFSRFALGHVLYTLKDPRETLRRLAYVASPDAILTATTPVHGAKPLAVFRAHRAMARQQKQPAHAIRTFLSLLEVLLINLVIVKILGKSGPYHLATEAEVRAWFKDTGWEIQKLSRAYGDQDWFVTAVRVQTQ